MFFADAHRAYGKHAEIDAVLHVHAAQKGAPRVPIFFGRDPIIFITEARRPFGGRNQRAVIGDDVKKIELLRLGDAVRVIVILRSIGLRAVQVNRHANGRFGIGNSLHAVRDFFAALRVLAVKLRHQRVGALAIE